MARVYSVNGAVGDTLSIPTDPHFNQTFVTAKYFSDADRTTEVTPSAGTIAIEGRPNGGGGFSTLSMSPIDCTDTGDFGSTDVPLDELRFTPSSIAGAAYYQITVTSKAM